jgi:hypothetical protein
VDMAQAWIKLAQRAEQDAALNVLRKLNSPPIPAARAVAGCPRIRTLRHKRPPAARRWRPASSTGLTPHPPGTRVITAATEPVIHNNIGHACAARGDGLAGVAVQVATN